MAKSEVVPVFKVGDRAIVKEDIFPESEYWEKGYWKIPKGRKVRIAAIELSDSKSAELDEIYLIEYLDATFWIEQSMLEIPIIG